MTREFPVFCRETGSHPCLGLWSDFWPDMGSFIRGTRDFAGPEIEKDRYALFDRAVRWLVESGSLVLIISL